MLVSVVFYFWAGEVFRRLGRDFRIAEDDEEGCETAEPVVG